jgi:type IV pilus assembly protein PilM
MIGQGANVSFFKSISIGAEQLNQAVARKLGISVEEARSLRRRLSETHTPAPQDAVAVRRNPVRQAVLDATRSLLEELGREISLCLRYHAVTFRGPRPSVVYLAGGEAADVQLSSFLSGVLPIPIAAVLSLLPQDKSAVAHKEDRQLGGEWLVALGLCLKQTGKYFNPQQPLLRGTTALPSDRDRMSETASSVESSEVVHV